MYQNDGVLRMNIMVNRIPFTKMERFVTHYYGVLATPKLSLSSEMHAPKFSYDARFNYQNSSPLLPTYETQSWRNMYK